MRSSKCSLIFSIVLILLFFQSNFGSENWLNVKTKRFEVYGNTSNVELLKFAEQLENFHQIVAQSFGQTEISIPFKTKIIVFKDVESRNRYRLNFKDFNNYFTSAEDVNYGIIQLNHVESFEQVYSGYTKCLLENHFGRNVIPPWLFEAIAEYFKGIRFLGNDQYELPISPKTNEILQTSKQIPIQILVSTPYLSLENQDVNRKNLFRAQSNELFRYLIKDSDKLQKIQRFIELRQNDIDEKRAFVEAFEVSLTKFNDGIPAYSNKNTNLKELSVILETIEPKVERVSESKLLALVADSLFYAGHVRESENLIEKAFKIDSNEPLALTTLALIKAKTFYYDQSESLAEKAVEVEPDNFLNHYRLALCLSKRGMTEFGFVSGYDRNVATRIKESAQNAISLDSDFAASYALLAFVNYVRNDDLDLALEMIGKALNFAKGNHQYQLRLAELNLRKERFLIARKLAYGVLQSTPSQGVRLYAQNTIQRIDSTEFQLERIKNNKAKYVNDDLVTEQPLSEEEIKRLREKATNDQIRNSLRRPSSGETRVFGSLKRIECSKNKVDFFVTTANGQMKVQSNSLDGINLLSLVEDMSDYRLSCGTLVKENSASIIFKKDTNKIGEIVSIEFVPKWFKFEM